MSIARYGTWRRLASMFAAGVLLQTAGCSVATQDLLAQLLQSVFSTFITDYVNSMFNVSSMAF